MPQKHKQPEQNPVQSLQRFLYYVSLAPSPFFLHRDARASQLDLDA